MAVLMRNNDPRRAAIGKGRDAPSPAVVVAWSVSEALTSPADGRALPEDVTPVLVQPLPGGHWLKLTPARPLDFGEYALLEILDDRRINLGVWDFGVHPTAPENRDSIHPEPHRPSTLHRATIGWIAGRPGCRGQRPELRAAGRIDIMVETIRVTRQNTN